MNMKGEHLGTGAGTGVGNRTTTWKREGAKMTRMDVLQLQD